MSYDEKSDDSTFTHIIGRLDQQARDTANFRTDLLTVLNEVRMELKEVKVEVKATNGRVRGLEIWKAVITAKVATISTCVSLLVGGVIWVIKQFL